MLTVDFLLGIFDIAVLITVSSLFILLAPAGFPLKYYL
jgi:hypothetical protein